MWVSNHGGRRLDRAMATAHALPQDAAAVFLGRAPFLPLAAGGETTLGTVLDVLGRELVGAVRLAGLTRPQEASEVLVGGLWAGSRRSDLTVP